MSNFNHFQNLTLSRSFHPIIVIISYCKEETRLLISAKTQKCQFCVHVQRVHVIKYLGVFINEKLSWTEHINHLVSKVSRLSGILYRNKIFLPMNCKQNIYFALIHSNLTYCIEVYIRECK